MMLGCNMLLVALLLALLVDSVQTKLSGPATIDNKNSSYTMTLLKNFGEKDLSRIRYLHFPRTGFPFAITVIRYACEQHLTDVTKNKERDWMMFPKCKERIANFKDFYKPTPLQYEDAQITVAMFRNPKDRFASQLRWMRSMARFVTTYGVHERDVAPLLNMLNVVPSAKSLNASSPCYYASVSKDSLRFCRYTLDLNSQSQLYFYCM